MIDLEPIQTGPHDDVRIVLAYVSFNFDVTDSSKTLFISRSDAFSLKRSHRIDLINNISFVCHAVKYHSSSDYTGDARS